MFAVQRCFFNLKWCPVVILIEDMVFRTYHGEPSWLVYFLSKTGYAVRIFYMDAGGSSVVNSSLINNLCTHLISVQILTIDGIFDSFSCRKCHDKKAVVV